MRRSPHPRALPWCFLLVRPPTTLWRAPLMYPQAHSDVFGGDFDGDGIDSVGMDYESKYDDFM